MNQWKLPIGVDRRHQHAMTLIGGVIFRWAKPNLKRFELEKGVSEKLRLHTQGKCTLGASTTLGFLKVSSRLQI
ncbi:hypothetical protein PanWU01x14_118240 [Parasponia andersonii]|uniref:Uncharacterized protein n=1 Tax=Parasponia andersonii TaxID=3476 RepID=A0A2P5CW97_PARAD|nr:hypothetical protein PanWU01x14_118240 [Parasponia andersonii]